ncbi:thioredoxin [Flammeovirga sp. SJP92]|uniref:thioredoxin n=1 Tax=Flammeovirga sp. SJP92 TaxID=1775430 RepID=UPI0007885CC1|nr:thioredoxin [Flammeovirga sp. SJP92]KXX70699.1 thioredoxin [Flammeovirga sp. SJP92]
MAVKNLSLEEFKDKIFDYTNNEDWNYKGDKPALIDFYADWCGPCKMVAPILDELAEEYDGKVDIYKVNTEIEQELSSMFGIRSIPSLLFIPMEDVPKMQKGALQKNDFKKAFEAEFGIK